MKRSPCHLAAMVVGVVLDRRRLAQVLACVPREGEVALWSPEPMVLALRGATCWARIMGLRQDIKPKGALP